MNLIGPVFLAIVLALASTACMKEEPVAAEPSAGRSTPSNEVETGDRTFDQRLASGKKLYTVHCAACHQANGAGLGGAFPPVAGSDFLADGPAVVVEVILNGLNGPITVNGVEYNAFMPNLSYLNDRDVADVVTFVMNSWGNPGGEVSPGEVAAMRAGQIAADTD
jgi:mono/diheme cytochrome c family protein